VRRHAADAGLGRTPAYMKVDIDEHGRTIGLF
jgi:formyltetrahydrofolate synthetase